MHAAPKDPAETQKGSFWSSPENPNALFVLPMFKIRREFEECTQRTTVVNSITLS